MINRYYDEQLALLRSLGVEFAQKYPALAPMLAGQSADPDVERLIEGTAFLTGLVEERLDDDFPEIAHGLTELMFPHYLQPIPSSTIVRFSGRPELMVPQEIKKGMLLKSVPVDGINCSYTTIHQVTVYPLSVRCELSAPDKIELVFDFRAGSLAEFAIDDLRLYVSGDYGDAAHMVFDVANFVDEVIYSDSENSVTLAASEAISTLEPDLFELVPHKSGMFSAFRPVQGYFQMPESLCFMKLRGLSRLGSEQNSFKVEIKFSSERSKFRHNPGKVGFELFCVPAINVFPRDAETISVDYSQREYKVVPYRNGGNYKIYSVDKVMGYVQGASDEREYKPFENFNPQTTMVPLYTVRRRRSKLTKGSDVYISVAMPHEGTEAVQETLVLKTTCTNGSLTENLRYGDICVPTETMPMYVDYMNITHPTSPIECPLGKNLLWRLLSHIYLNQSSITNVDAMTSLLKLYIFTETENKAQVQVNTRRVESIVRVESEDAVRLVEGCAVRGKIVRIFINRDGFSSVGDMYLFASVLQRMLGAYTGINNFTIVRVCDLSTRNEFVCQQLEMGTRNNL